MRVTVMVVTLIVQLLVTRGLGTPLDDYVNRKDPTYKYEILQTFQGAGYTLYNINMTSQTWKPDLQSQPVWWHYLSVTIPVNLELGDAAFLFIEGGSNNNKPPKPTDTWVEITTMVAIATHSITANLKMVPNQPIVFKDDPSQKERTEDAIIAWTWMKFLEQKGADPEILLRMPMTKAGVRALDTIDDLAQKTVGSPVTRFLVAGASKRGWTTWTVGAVDKRVVAIAPIVMDLLNMSANMHHFYRALGGWTFAFADYFEVNFTAHIDSPYMKSMADIIDPLSYNDRWGNIPKLITSTGGDEFFMVDDSNYYFDQLKGPNYLRMIPNTDHSLFGHKLDVMLNIGSFYLYVMKKEPLPAISWKMNTNSTGGKISFVSNTIPLTIHCYKASTLDGKRKDFRLVIATPGDPNKPEPHPVLWRKQDVTQTGKLSWEVELNNPVFGWTAFFIQVTFDGPKEHVLEVTSQTLIIPETDPFPDCHGLECKGTLV